MEFSQLARLLQFLMGEFSDQTARKCGFIQRQGKLSDANFAQSLMFGWLQKARPI